MKNAKVLLALMAVTMMVIVPLSVADVDAEKTQTTGQAGASIDSTTVLDKNKFYDIVGKSPMFNESTMEDKYVSESKTLMQDIFRCTFPYLHDEVLNNTTFTTGYAMYGAQTIINITDYETVCYDEVKDLKKEGAESTIVKGNVTIYLAVRTSTYLMKSTGTEGENDLVTKVNSYIERLDGNDTTQSIVKIESEFSTTIVNKVSYTYSAAKDAYVKNTEYVYKGINTSSSSTITALNNDSRSVTVNYSESSATDWKIDFSYDQTVSEETAAPSAAKCSYHDQRVEYRTSMTGKVNGSDYTSDLSEYKKTIEDKQNSRSSRGGTSVSSDFKTETIKVSGKTTVAGLMGETQANADKFVSDYALSISDNYESAKDKVATADSTIVDFADHSNDALPVWVWIVVAIAVIIVAVAVVLWLKKSGRI